jgi:hypothetical protein
MKDSPSISPIRFTRDIAPAYTLSIITTLLMTVFSLAGIFFQSAIYPSEDLSRSFVSNDVVNLFIGLPLLLGSMWLARRGKLIGLLLWSGALFYVTYNYIAYAFARFFSVEFIVYLALAVLSVYAIFKLLTNLEFAAIQQRLNSAVPERFAAGVLVGLSVLFLLQSIGQVFGALSGSAALSTPKLAVALADILITPVWVVGGVQLWQRKAFGYVAGAGLLFQASMLFIGLLVFFILQPILASVPFPATDFGVIFGMGLLCFIPFGLFVRGIIAKGSISSATTQEKQ